MPSIQRSTKWFVRVDGNKEYLTEKCIIVKQWIDTQRMLCLFHLGGNKENPHCHFVIELSSELQKQTFATRIKKVFAIDKKSNYSVKEWDGADHACSYMFHESDAPIISNKDFTQEEIDKFRSLNNDVQKVLEVNKSRAPGRAVDRLVEEFKGDTPARRVIVERFLELIRDGQIYEPGDFQLGKYIEEVYMRTRSADQWQEYVDERTARLMSRL